MAENNDFIDAFGGDCSWVPESSVTAYSESPTADNSLQAMPEESATGNGSATDDAEQTAMENISLGVASVIGLSPTSAIVNRDAAVDLSTKISTLGMVSLSEFGRGVYNLGADLASFAGNSYNSFMRNIGVADEEQQGKIDLAEEYKFPTNKDIVEFTGINALSNEYAKHSVGYDIAGGIGSVVSGGAIGAQMFTVGSRLYNTLRASGISDSALGYVFANTASADKAVSSILDYSKLLASRGVNPSQVAEVVNKAGKATWKAAKEYFKVGVSSEAVAASLNYSNDVVYNPYRSTSQKLIEDVGLPTMVAAIPGAITYASLRRGINRAVAESAKVRKGIMATAFGEEYSNVADKNLSRLNQANIAVMDSYQLNELRKIRSNAVNDVTNLKQSGDLADESIDDVYNSFGDEIRSLENQRLASVSSLVNTKIATKDKAALSKFIADNMDDKPNLVLGANEIRYIPDTNAELDDLVYSKVVKERKLKHKIEHAKKPETKKKYEEAYDRLSTETYVVVKSDGSVIPAADYHISFRDTPGFHKNIKVTTPTELGIKSKLVTAKAALGDTQYSVSADVAGTMLVNDGKSATNRIAPELSDVGWAVLQNQRNTAKETLTKLAEKNVIKTIDLDKAGFQQVAYLAAIAKDNTKDRLFDRVIKLKEGGLEVTKEVLADRYLTKARESLRGYLKQVGELTAKGQHSRYPISTLFEETFNLKPKEGTTVEEAIELLASDAPNKQVISKVAVSNRLAYSPSSRPAMIRQTSAVDDYQKIQENVFKENSMRNQTVRDVLTGRLNVNGKRYFINDIADDLYNHPAFDTATDVEALSAMQGRLGKAGKYLLQTTFRYDTNLPLRAMSMLSNELDLKAAKQINAKLKPLSEALTPIVSDSAKKVELNSFVHQMRSNWRVAPELERQADGSYLIPLDTKQSAINQKVADRQAMFYKDMGDIFDPETTAYVPDPFDPSKPLRLSPEVAQVAELMQSLSSELWENQQLLNYSLGKRQVAYRSFHVPPKNLAGKEVMVVADRETHEPITFVVGNTVEQARELAKREQSLTDLATEITPLNSIKAYKGILDTDAEWVNMADYGDMVRQLQSSRNTGGVRRSVGALVDVGTDSIRELVDSYNSAFHKEVVRTRLAAMQGQIDYVQGLKSQLADSDQFGSSMQEWLDNAFGLTSATKMQNRTGIGDIYNAFDAALTKSAQIASDFNHALSEKQRLRFLEKLEDNEPRDLHQLFKGAKGYREFKRVFKQSENPVADAIDFVNRSNLGTRLSLPKEIMAKTSSIMSMAMLRIANLGFALTNIVSLPATIPGTMIALNKRAGETLAEWQTRVGLFGKGIALDNEGRDFVRGIDLVGSMFDTIGWMFTKDGREVNSLAKELGYFDTNASLMNEIFVTPTMSKTQKFLTKGVDVASFLSDKSESLSRTIPFLMGYRLADKSGMVSDPKAKMAFAKQFMDDVVGNYQSNVRPMVHKQALGIPTSLFYTYAQNYGQRLFDYIENKDVRALAIQSLTQGLVFGAKGVTGSSTVFDRLFPVESGDSPYQALQRTYGDDLARYFIYGVPSALTGLDFASKGSMADARLPIITSPQDMVAYSATVNTIKGMSETFKATKSETGLTTTRLEEIWQNYAVSPFVKAALDTHLGYVTNRAGEKIIDKTEDTLWHSANILAMKSIQESETATQLYRNSQRELRQQSAMATLRKNVRAIQRDLFLRDGTIDGELLLDLVVDYTDAGGKSENFIKYFRDQLSVSLLSKQYNVAKSLAKKGTEESFTSAIGLLGLTRSSLSTNELEPTVAEPVTKIPEQVNAFGDDDSWIQ